MCWPAWASLKTLSEFLWSCPGKALSGSSHSSILFLSDHRWSSLVSHLFLHLFPSLFYFPSLSCTACLRSLDGRWGQAGGGPSGGRVRVTNHHALPVGNTGASDQPVPAVGQSMLWRDVPVTRWGRAMWRSLALHRWVSSWTSSCASSPSSSLEWCRHVSFPRFLVFPDVSRHWLCFLA